MTDHLPVATAGQQLQPASAVLPIKDVQMQVAQIQQIMQDVMTKGVHYGDIPGCDKPVLLQPGAEKLCFTFRLSPRFSVTEQPLEDGHLAFRAICEVYSIATGSLLSSAIGECSTSKEKYAWKRPVCDQEYAATPADRRRVIWKKGNNGPFEVKQIRTNAGDQRNTASAMAQKRAFVRATRAALAASDLFEVNIEDLPDEIREEIFGDGSERPKTSEALNKRQNPGASRPAPAAPASGGPAGNTVIPFGKHKGQRFCDVPVDYIEWLADKSTSPDIKDAAVSYLNLLKGGSPHADEVAAAEQQMAAEPPDDITNPFADQ